ncbi:biotin/lipoyl-containing protein [Agrilactobacillus fermenti]|uniref:biotin/lipoyl-containing protein n=1 Tax=Agrilactobacillus fermenti TaxID=2586909 RepID=UPI003A5B9A5D
MLRKFRIKIDGNEYEVEMEELTPTPQPQDSQTPPQSQPIQSETPKAAPQAQPVQPKPAASPSAASGSVKVTAPMPGNIIGINIKVGDAVAENQPILILEAMKMENEIVAPQAGTITSIDVVKNDVVNTGDVLVTID